MLFKTGDDGSTPRRSSFGERGGGRGGRGGTPRGKKYLNIEYLVFLFIYIVCRIDKYSFVTLLDICNILGGQRGRGGRGGTPRGGGRGGGRGGFAASGANKISIGANGTGSNKKTSFGDD